MATKISIKLNFRTAQEFGAAFTRNLEECEWEPHPLYSVFTQYDKEYYLARKTAFLEKYRCFYAVSKTISPKTVLELGTSAGAGADAYLSATPKAKYIGFDVFAEAPGPNGSPPWKPQEIAAKLFAARGFKDYELIRINLRKLDKLPCRSDFVVVDGGHDFDNQYSDLRLALTADPDFIFVDDCDAEGKPAIQKFLSEDLKDRVAFTFQLNYMGGGLVIKLDKPDSANGLITFRPEFSVEALKATIRAAVARREAEGRASFINASAKLLKILAEDALSWDTPAPAESQTIELSSGLEKISLLNLHPEFSPNKEGHYHVNDLLHYHDAAFIWNAYRALLKREPDEEGFQRYLELLRSGQRNKIDILGSLHRSPEGKRANVSVEGLTAPAIIRRLYRLPIIGYLLELIVALVRLPVLMRSQRQMENHLVAQQDRVAGHFNYTNRQLVDEIDRLGRELNQQLREQKDRNNTRADSFQTVLTDLFLRQHRIAELNHQQMAALFKRQQKVRENHRSVVSPTDHVPKAGVDPTSQQGLGLVDLDKLEAAFIDHMRGTPDTVKEEARSYLPLLKNAGVSEGIVDLGCGRGEWLELLGEEGLHAVGVESNLTLAAAGRSRGLEITSQPAVEYLQGLPNNRLQAVTGFHVIEHLEFEALFELLSEVHRVLKPGGIVILETPNPKNLVVGACNFYADPTHHKPIFPETLQFLLDGLGFERIRIEYKHPVEGSPFDNSAPGSQELHTWLFGPRDYAAIAWKA